MEDIKEGIAYRMETLIFLSKDPLALEELSKFYGINLEEVENVLADLKEKRKRSGINLRIEDGMVSLVSNPMYGEDVKSFFNPELKIRKLTKATMETLAIIAYKGPITKSEIEQIKGVNAEKTMANLLEKKLIHISGKKKAIGTPNLYEVTEDFYSYLNIEGKSQLPGYEQYEKIELLHREGLYADSGEGKGQQEDLQEKESKEETEIDNET